MDTYQQVLDALGDATRRDILGRLRRGPAAVNEIAADLPVSRPAVSQHLRVLRDAGLVDFEPHGTRNLYRLDRAGFDELRHWLDTYWQEVLDAFEGYARRSTKQ